MKVTIIKNLNVRVGAPSLNAPCYQYLAPGSIIEVDGKNYKGDTYLSSNDWMKDDAGNYYWRGGLSWDEDKQEQDKAIQQGSTNKITDIPDIKIEGESLSKTINYNQLLNINPEFKKSLGEGAVIALLDTGVFRHKALEGAILPEEFDFTNSQALSNDKSGHGTFLSGLICSGEGASHVIGIAPRAKLLNIKVIKDSGSTFGPYLESGLRKALEILPFGIINMSLGLTMQEYEILVQKQLFEKFSTHYVCVAAAGENEQLLASNGILAPSIDENIIAVGTIDSNFFSLNRAPQFDNRLDFIIPQFELISCDTNNGFNKQDGVSSMACAIVSSILALLFPGERLKHISANDAKIKLNQIATSYNQIAELDSLILIKP